MSRHWLSTSRSCTTTVFLFQSIYHPTHTEIHCYELHIQRFIVTSLRTKEKFSQFSLDHVSRSNGHPTLHRVGLLFRCCCFFKSGILYDLAIVGSEKRYHLISEKFRLKFIYDESDPKQNEITWLIRNSFPLKWIWSQERKAILSNF